MNLKIFLIAISVFLMLTLVSAIDANKAVQNMQDSAEQIVQGKTPISGTIFAITGLLDGATKMFAGLLNAPYGQAAMLTLGLLMFPLALILGLLARIAKFVPWISVGFGIFFILIGAGFI